MHMRVLHIISRMNSGGTATYLNNLVSGLSDSGIDSVLIHGTVSAIELAAPNHPNINSCQILSMGRNLSLTNDLKSRHALQEIIKDFKPSVIHSHAFKAGLIARSLERKNEKRVHTFHGHHLYDPEFGAISRSALKLVERKLSSRTDAFVTVGNRVGVELRQAGILTKESISIPPGVSALERFERDSARLELGVPRNVGFVVGWMARFVDVKRPQVLIELAKAFPSIFFVAAGSGPLLQHIEAVRPTNLLLPGWISPGKLLSAIDILISTSRSEGMPLSMIEAQLHGRPVIAPDVGSVREVIKDKITGFLVGSDLVAMPRLIKKLENDEDLRNVLAHNAETFSQIEFSHEKMIERHIELYKRLS